MRVSVKNNSPALQGVSTLEGTKWIKPGASLTISVEDTRSLERLPFLEIQYSEAGVPIGDLPPPPSSLLAAVSAKAQESAKTASEVAYDKAKSAAAAEVHAVSIQGSAAETEVALKKLRALDHDGDGKAGGGTSAVDDIKALRAAYQEQMGKRAYPGWDAAELKRRMAEA